MDGSDGQTDLRMCMPDNVGAFYRSSTKSDGSALCLGGQLTICWPCTLLSIPISLLHLCTGQVAVFPLSPACFVLPCPVLFWPCPPCSALPCPALPRPCPIMPCSALPCPTLSALPCPALSALPYSQAVPLSKHKTDLST